MPIRLAAINVITFIWSQKDRIAFGATSWIALRNRERRLTDRARRTRELLFSLPEELVMTSRFNLATRSETECRSCFPSSSVISVTSCPRSESLEASCDNTRSAPPPLSVGMMQASFKTLYSSLAAYRESQLLTAILSKRGRYVGQQDGFRCRC